MRTRLTVTTALVALALAGCGSSTTGSGGATSASDQPSTLPTTPSATPSATSTLPSTPPSVPPPADDAIPDGLADRPEVKAALADAAGRAGIVPGKVEIAGYSQVTWNDGSLGCPKKGESYTQMTVEGELLRLKVDQRVMEYHGRVGGPFTFCATPNGGFSAATG